MARRQIAREYTSLGFQLTIDDTQISDLMSEARRDVQNAFKAGMRRALKLVRERAAATAPNPRWQNPNRGYRTKVDTQLTDGGGFAVVGRLWSKFPGNIYEAGQPAHWIAISDGVERWAKRHGVSLKRKGMFVRRGGERSFVPFEGNDRLAQWAKMHSVTLKSGNKRPLDEYAFMHVRQQPPRPFVIPAGEAMEEEARDAFRVTIEEALADYG